jgi:hypothetical protein
VVERARKNFSKDQIKPLGTRWTLQTADAMSKLRATQLSGEFE